MLSPALTRLTHMVAVLFALLGGVLFLLPSWSAANFPWTITPFVAMTMGGWYLGSAAMAWESARVRDWSESRGTLLFVWSFSLFEALLLLIHASVLQLGQLLALPYILTLAIAAVSAGLGIVEWIRVRPVRDGAGLRQPLGVRVLLAGFVVYVTYLAAPLLAGYARGGSVWPGQLTLLTARCFGAFFLSLVLGTIPLVRVSTLSPVEAYMRAGFIMTSVIQIAAFAFIQQFDFEARPGGLLYIGSYFAAMGGSALILLWGWWLRRRTVTASQTTMKGGLS